MQSQRGVVVAVVVSAGAYDCFCAVTAVVERFVRYAISLLALLHRSSAVSDYLFCLGLNTTAFVLMLRLFMFYVSTPISWLRMMRTAPLPGKIGSVIH